MNRIYCPIENGWAERINRARKPHKCTRCHRTITEGSSYVCLHVSKATYAWESTAMCNDCYVEAFEKSSEIVENSINEFLNLVTPEQRKQCIDIIFEILESTNENTFHEFKSNWFKNSTQVVKYVSKIKPDERKVVMDAAKMFMSIMFDEYKSTIVQKEGN